MFCKLIGIKDKLTTYLELLPIPQNYQQSVINETLAIVNPQYLNLPFDKTAKNLLSQPELKREQIIQQELALITQAYTSLQKETERFRMLVRTSITGNPEIELLNNICKEFAVLANLKILDIQAKDVTKFENKINKLLADIYNKPVELFDISKVQKALYQLQIKNLTTLHPSAQMLILLNCFAVSVLFQTINNFETITLETCIELRDCTDKLYYSELLPKHLANNLLFHCSLEPSIDQLLAWAKQDYKL